METRDIQRNGPSGRVSDAWKIFTKSIDVNEAKARARLSGDESLGLTVLRTVAIIA